MLRLRFLTGVIGLALVLFSILSGRPLFTVLIAVVAVMCAVEVCRLAPGLHTRDPLFVLAVVWAVLLALRHEFQYEFGWERIVRKVAVVGRRKGLRRAARKAVAMIRFRRMLARAARNA